MIKKSKIVIAIIIIVILLTMTILLLPKDNTELKTIKTEKQLSKIYEGESSETHEIFINILTMPFSFLINGSFTPYSEFSGAGMAATDSQNVGTISPEVKSNVSTTTKSSETSTPKDYSTTNIQVENVDEADIIKTDGDYIYSISENNIIITNVEKPEEMKIEATIKLNDGSIPEDLILYKDKLVVISTKAMNNSNTNYFYGTKRNTIVKIYNISTKSNPSLIKNYELYEPYYTSRCINNVLYVISSGGLREEDNKIVRTYKEDNTEQEIEFKNIKYLKDVKTNQQTIISVVDLNNAKAKISVSSYLIDISNAYVSENSIYLLNEKYDYKRNTYK